MRIVRNLESVTYNKNRIITVGTFDGVHLGHKEIFRVMKERAKEIGAEFTVVSFDPHPRLFLQPDSGLKLLTTLKEKSALLESLGVDLFIVLKFDRELSQNDSETFLKEYLLDKIGFSEIAVGYDHRFGKGRDGDGETIRKFAREHSLASHTIEAVEYDETKVSSSRIRELLLEGDVKTAAKLLGRYYSFEGTVVKGLQRGRQLGFPTANVNPSEELKQLARNGVYAVCVEFDGITLNGVMNSGTRPTFDDKTEVFHEIHLFEFSGDIYGKELQVAVIEQIRDEKKFNGMNELIAQITADADTAKSILRKIQKPFVYF